MKSIRLMVLGVAAAALLVAPLVLTSAEAQGRRAVRRAAAPRSGGVVVGGYYRPLFLSSFYDPFYDPWWYPYPHGWYAQPYAYGRAYQETASLRLQVTPRETEVFVDGYYAGIVDEFDGLFQRLHLEPGAHDVTLYLAGHRTVTRQIFLQDRGTFRIEHTMELLGAGETGDPRPTAVPGERSRRGGEGPDTRGPRPAPDAVRGDSSYGAMAIRVQPADADVLIDGERWEGPQSDEALVVQVAPGTHRIEVRRDGYRPYTSEVTVTAAQTSPLNVSLSPE